MVEIYLELPTCRRSRVVEHDREIRRRKSHSPAKGMEVDGAVREMRGRAKGRPVANIGERTSHVQSRRFDERRNPERERDLNSNTQDSGRRNKATGESEEEADRQRLIESLIDPQEVPRSGYYFEVSLNREEILFFSLLYTFCFTFSA